MAPDNAFAVALLTLWHRVAEAGGAVGFTSPVDRAQVGGAVSEVVDALRSGRADAFALTRSRHVVGFAMLQPGIRNRSHTADLTSVMVEPASQGSGWGRLLVQALLDLASSNSLQRIRVGVPGGARLEGFFAAFGFVEIGRLPAWIRLAPGDDRDEVLMVRELR